MSRLAVAIVIGLALMLASCSSWSLRSNSGRACVVRKGQTTAEVFGACGAPDRSATQPKRIESGDSLLQVIGCSAPAYAYGEEAVLMGCRGRVVGVQAAEGPGLVYDAAASDDGSDAQPRETPHNNELQRTRPAQATEPRR